MSIWHTREQDPKGKGTNVVFHIPVPVGNNDSGIPWNQCIRENMAPVPIPNVNSVEEAGITNGDILEVPEFVGYDSTSSTDAEKIAKIQAKYVERSAELIAALAFKLENWGYSA